MNKTCPWCGEEPIAKGATHVQCGTYDCPGSRILYTASEWNERKVAANKEKQKIERDNMFELTTDDHADITLNDDTDYYLDSGTESLVAIRGYNNRTRRSLNNFRIFRKASAMAQQQARLIKELTSELTRAMEKV